MLLSRSPFFDSGWALAAAALLGLGLTGCGGVWGDASRGWFSAEESHTLANKPIPVAERGVTISGATLNLGDSAKAALTPEQLLLQIAPAAAEQKQGAVRRLVRRYPDVALEALRAATSEQAAQPGYQALAFAYDTLAGQQPGVPGWLALLRQRAAEPQRYADYQSMRRRLLDHWQHGQFQEAAALQMETRIPSDANPLLALDAWQLAGTAQLLSDNPAAAAAAFAQASNLAGDNHLHQGVQIESLRSEAERRAGRHDEAAQRWLAAVDVAARLLAASEPVVDPILWERLAYLRPVKTPWPPAARGALARLPAPHGLEQLAVPPQQSAPANLPQLADEALLWAQIGHWRLARDEAQAALLAFKQAEAAAMGNSWRERMQLESARALVRMGQTPAATAILMRIAGNRESPLARSATAMFGTLRLAAGQTQQGLLVLRRACEENAPPQWLGQASAEADLGLAYLLVGDEATGLRWLHSAQQHFAAARDDDQLLASLANEANYLERKERYDQLAAVRERLVALEK